MPQNAVLLQQINQPRRLVSALCGRKSPRPGPRRSDRRSAPGPEERRRAGGPVFPARQPRRPRLPAGRRPAFFQRFRRFFKPGDNQPRFLANPSKDCRRLTNKDLINPSISAGQVTLTRAAFVNNPLAHAVSTRSLSAVTHMPRPGNLCARSGTSIRSGDTQNELNGPSAAFRASPDTGAPFRFFARQAVGGRNPPPAFFFALGFFAVIGKPAQLFARFHNQSVGVVRRHRVFA